MDGTETNWMFPLTVFVLGAIAGYIVIRFARKDAAKRQAKPSAKPSDLESIVDQLRTMDDADDVAGERYALELQAAALLRAPAQAASVEAPREERLEPRAGNRSAVAGFLWGTAATTVVAILILAATRTSNERVQDSAMVASVQPSIAAAAEAMPPPAIPDGPGIAGIIVLDESVASRVATPAIVFLIARPVGEPKGMPIAAKRLDAPSFPLAFQLTNADSMMGEALPEQMRLEARIDTDGDVVSRDPNDPTGFVDPIGPGAMSARIVLSGNPHGSF